MTDEELRKEVIELFYLHPDNIINSGYGMPTPITILDIYKAGRRKTLQEKEKLKEDHAKQIEYLNSRIPPEGLQAMLSPSELVDFREYERRVEIRKKQQLKAAFDAGRKEVETYQISGGYSFNHHRHQKYKTFNDWYASVKGEKK